MSFKLTALTMSNRRLGKATEADLFPYSIRPTPFRVASTPFQKRRFADLLFFIYIFKLLNALQKQMVKGSVLIYKCVDAVCCVWRCVHL